MIVYADILIFVNFLVDCFLIKASGLIIRQKIKTFNLIISAVLGGISSLYIFAPPLGAFADVLFKFIICGVCAAVSFWGIGFKHFIKGYLVLLAVTFAYGGCMTFIYKNLKTDKMAIFNSVVYFDISPLTLIISTALFYIVLWLLSLIFKRNFTACESCDITAELEGKSKKFTALIDTGNALTDSFGGSVIVADATIVESLFTDVNEENRNKRLRVIPCSTASGEGLLYGYRCDSATVKTKDGGTVNLCKPILAISKARIPDRFDAVINPEIFV